MIKNLKKWQQQRQLRKQRAAVQPRIYQRAEHGVSRSQMPENVLKVLNRLHKSGYAAYLVGGGVRDLLAGVRPKDFDIATDAKPEEVRKLFRNSIIIGRRFRIVHVRFGRETIEVVTFRGEGSEFANDKARKHSKSGMILRDNVYGDINSDVWRRDFTVNALYYNIADFSIVDYVGGIEDVKAKKIRIIGDPATRYREDPARILRALRLAGKLNFSIEQNTLAPLTDLVSSLAAVSADRLFVEVMKVFYGGGGYQAFGLLKQYRVFELLFPQLSACLGQGLTESMVTQTLYNADQRYAQGKSLSAAFLFAALLWQPLQQALDDSKQAQPKQSFRSRFDGCARQLLQTQNQTVAIPKRVAESVQSIWELQYRMAQRAQNDPVYLLGHPRFRAGYDLMMLRAQVGEPVTELALWWEGFQNADSKQQQEMLKPLLENAERHSPRRRSSGREK